jgi:hypothetical protein
VRPRRGGQGGIPGMRETTLEKGRNGPSRNGIHFCKIRVTASCCHSAPIIIAGMDHTRESAQSLIRTAITSLEEAKTAFTAEYRALRPSKGRKCTRCGEPMTVSVTVRRLGSHPEIQAFRCEVCRNVTMLVDGQEERPVDINDTTFRGAPRYWPSR